MRTIRKFALVAGMLGLMAGPACGYDGFWNLNRPLYGGYHRPYHNLGGGQPLQIMPYYGYGGCFPTYLDNYLYHELDPWRPIP